MIFKMRSEGNDSYVKQLLTNVDGKSEEILFLFPSKMMLYFNTAQELRLWRHTNKRKEV